MVEATNAKGNITSYDVVYHNGAPVIVYTVASANDKSTKTQSESGLSTQSDESDSSDDSDEVTSMEVASGDSLRDADLTGVFFDEMEVDAGQIMPVSAEFNNDGIVPLNGVDLYLYNEALDEGPKLMTSTSDIVLSGDEGTASFEMQLPDLERFQQYGKEMQYHLLVVPMGTSGITVDTMIEEGDDTLKFKLGDPHLALETEHHLIDGQESVMATVKNEGIVTSQPATLVFEKSEDGADLQRVEVPALAQNETFTFEHYATDGYFQKSGVTDLTIMLEDPNDPEDIYSLYNTDSIYTWEVNDNPAPAAKATATSVTSKATTPKTGDEFPLAVAVLAMLALAVFVSPFMLRKIREVRDTK